MLNWNTSVFISPAHQPQWGRAHQPQRGHAHISVCSSKARDQPHLHYQHLHKNILIKNEEHRCYQTHQRHETMISADEERERVRETWDGDHAGFTKQSQPEDGYSNRWHNYIILHYWGQLVHTQIHRYTHTQIYTHTHTDLICLKYS